MVAGARRPAFASAHQCASTKSAWRPLKERGSSLKALTGLSRRKRNTHTHSRPRACAVRWPTPLSLTACCQLCRRRISASTCMHRCGCSGRVSRSTGSGSVRDMGTSGCWLSRAGNRIGRHASDGSAVQAVRKSDRLAHGAYTRGCPLGADRDAGSALRPRARAAGVRASPVQRPIEGPHAEIPAGPSSTTAANAVGDPFTPGPAAPVEPVEAGRDRSRRSRRVMLECQGKQGGCP